MLREVACVSIEYVGVGYSSREPSCRMSSLLYLYVGQNRVYVGVCVYVYARKLTSCEISRYLNV